MEVRQNIRHVLIVLLIAIICPNIVALSAENKAAQKRKYATNKRDSALCVDRKYVDEARKRGQGDNSESAKNKVLVKRNLCDAESIKGPAGEAELPLPATIERLEKIAKQTGLIFSNGVLAEETDGKSRERYRLNITDNHLTEYASDVSFDNLTTAGNYADSVAKSLRTEIQSKDETIITTGIGGYKKYYLPAIICGNRAIGHALVVSPKLGGNIIVTHEVKVVTLPK